ncbi:hypothetical protein ASPCAL08931 [Aspergillus calidoustus]|uniref:Uncharacterized protein n=1 Tax=Aspergillus calidoustus TaxID=454130 RepID=A0A0U5GRP8_ASPCI|nr:hypothetical protein ASPCAL08931 [Aspergillus calidoustus]
MAVNALPQATTPLARGLSSTAPSTNKRLPPLADRSSLTYKLTNLSKQKLAREATAPDPDIRRCLVHFRLHCRSIEWAQQEAATKITSFEFEDDESEDEEAKEEQQEREEASSPVTITLTPPEPEAVQAQQAEEVSSTTTIPSKEDQTILVHFEGRRCIEKAQNGFWPSPGQCMPVRIAG